MKVSVIGAGRVGAAIAFSLIHNSKYNEVVLIDLMEDLVKGEALDLAHSAVLFSPRTKVAGSKDSSVMKDSDFVVITAGRARKEGESRKDLIEFNSRIVSSVCKDAERLAPNATILIVTNPATQMAEVARKNCKNKVVAMDNQLDGARLKYYIANETGLPLEAIKSYVTGEHGMGMKCHIKDNLTDEQTSRVIDKTTNTGMNLIKLKGYTCWGIAAAVVKEIERLS